MKSKKTPWMAEKAEYRKLKWKFRDGKKYFASVQMIGIAYTVKIVVTFNVRQNGRSFFLVSAVHPEFFEDCLKKGIVSYCVPKTIRRFLCRAIGVAPPLSQIEWTVSDV